jgi:hypothetical protein
MKTRRKLTDAEIATILHGLRMIQKDGPINEAGSCDHFEEVEILTDREIDQLAASINFDTLELV